MMIVTFSKCLLYMSNIVVSAFKNVFSQIYGVSGKRHTLGMSNQVMEMQSTSKARPRTGEAKTAWLQSPALLSPEFQS